MRLIRLIFCLFVLALLSHPADSATESARPLIVIYRSSGLGMIWDPWPMEMVVYDTGEAFAGDRDITSLRRLQLDPERLDGLMKQLRDVLADVPKDAGSNPHIFDAHSLRLLIWDEKSQTYSEHYSYGYYCDVSPMMCAMMQVLDVDWRFNYWAHELPRMVRDAGEVWRPSYLALELTQTTDPLPLKTLPQGTIFDAAPAAMLFPMEQAGDRRIACVPTGDALDMDEVLPPTLVFQVLPSNGGRGQFGVAADLPGTWYIWNWHYATPYPAALPGISPVYRGCESR
jgi:hypothetical protein